LTFAHAAEKASDSDSSRSQVASFERVRTSAERLHPKTAYSRWRPIGAGGTLPAEQPDHSVPPLMLCVDIGLDVEFVYTS
jgi:hypothetical protein